MDKDPEYSIYRIMSGYYHINIEDVIYKVVLPDIKLKQRAQELYFSILESNKFDTSSWLVPSFIDNILKANDIWDDKKEKQLEDLYKLLESTKINLFLKYTNLQNRKSIKKDIVSIKNGLSSFLEQKHSLNHLTLEDYALSIKNQFIIANTIYFEDARVFDDIENMNIKFLEKIIREINKKSLGLDDIKYLCKHQIWKSYWDVAKENTFPMPASSWTEEQRLLISLSKTYDNIREHTECPSDIIIDDDDALDGWMLYQRDKISKEQRKADIEGRLGLNKQNGNEVFLMTSSQEEVKEILDLNSNETNADIREMIKVSNEKDGIPWVELPHVKRQIQQEIREKNKRK